MEKKVPTQDEIKGFLGGVENGYALGWVWNPANPEQRLEVVIYADDEPVAEGVAEEYREDLFKEGIGDGKYGFRIKVPENLADGKEHIIRAEVKKPKFTLPKECKVIITPEIKPPKIKGNFDGISGLYVGGWAYNQDKPEGKISIIVLADGKPVAEAIADQFREDLLKAGIGEGNHAFVVKLPEDLADGKEHEISIRVKETDIELTGSPKTFKFEGTYSFEIYGLIYNSIQGKVINNFNPSNPVLVEVYENNKKIAEGWSNPQKEHIFTIYLPSDVLDGKAHIFELRTKDGYLIGNIVDITPYIMTPFESLRKYSKEITNFYSPFAKYRYEAFINNINWLLNSEKIPLEVKEKAMREVYKAFEILSKGHENLREFKSLEFITYEKPLVSIVIPVHNKFEYTYNCLTSVLLSTYGIPYEVIIVDDGSKDKTTEITNIIKGIKYMRNEEAEGFVLACNKGARLAEGEYIVLLNNDTEVLNGWLNELLYVFENFKSVGFVGGKLLYPDLTLQEAGCIVWGNGDVWNYGRNQNAFHPKYNYIRQVDYCSGACIMLPKELWDELGGFDEEFAPAYWEETDLAFRVREKGYKVVYTPFAQVIHYEGVTAGKDVKSSGMKRYQEINRVKFKKKWSHALLHKTIKLSFEMADLVKDNNIAGRILVIDYEIPRPDREAGGYATFQEIKMFASLGFKVVFIPNNLAYLCGYVEDLQRLGIEVLYAPYYTSVREVIEKRGKEFNIFYIVRWHIALDYIDIIRQVNPEAKIIFNNADLHFLREIREALATNDKKLLENAIQTREKELGVMRRVDLVVSYNEAEHAVILSHNLDSTKVAKWPWVVYPKEPTPSFQNRKDIAFLGNYRHIPNITAVKFFVKKVMPLLKKRLPDVKFFIYGANVPEEFEELESENVIVKGYIKDLAELFNNIRVFVAPLLSGAGIKGKVLEALSYGVPSVLSPIAVEGTGIVNNLHALIAEEPKEWVEAIYNLYTDKELWENLSKNVVEFVKNEYSFEKGKKMVLRALEMLDVYVVPFNHLWVGVK